MPTPLVGPAYTQDALNPAVDRAINLFPEVQESKIAWQSTPGTTLAKDMATLNASATPIRGLYTATTGNLYVVAGTATGTMVYRWDNSSWVDALAGGVIDTGAHATYGPVSMCDNGTHLFIATDNDKTFTVDMATPSSAYIETSYTGGVKGRPVFLDGFIAYCRTDNNSVQVSAPYDIYNGTTSWNALDIRRAEASPDPLMSLATLNRQMFVFGKQSVEVWASSNSDDYPFAPVGGAPLPVGLLGEQALATTSRAVYWLGNSPSGVAAIYRSTGSEPERISTRAIDRIIAGATWANLALCRAWSYQQDGHTFVGFALTTSTGTATSTTLVYDEATELWHERRSNDMSTKARYDLVASAFGTVYGAEHGNTAHLLALGRTTATEYTASATSVAIQRERTAWHATDLARVFWPRYELVLDVGQSSVAVPFTVEYSDDGGYTWTAHGGTGANTYYARRFAYDMTRLVVQRAGVSRDRAWRFRSTAAATVTYTILDARAGVREGGT